MLSAQEKRKLVQFLEEDHYLQDVTSAITTSYRTRGFIRTNEPCVLAGLEEALFLFQHVEVNAKPLQRDGEKIRPGRVLELKGLNRNILLAERTVLNVLGRMSGVATLCRKAQDAVGKLTKIALTRKTIPGFNTFDKKAAVLAGVWPHRKNLEEAVLIKENHLVFFQSIAEAIRKAAETNKFVEIEVENIDQAKEAASAKPDMILLDNFPVSKAQKTIEAIRRLNPKVEIEISGGVNWRNVKSYAVLKPDFISMGLLTKEAKSVDFSLDILK